MRSDTGDVYRKAKTFLEQGRWVLFTGTPCQCSGLRTYLRRDYENLILCDIICHANPSPRVLRLYLQEIEKKYGRKVVQIQFRDKEKGWRTSKSALTLEGGKTVNDSLFRLAFLCDLINRPSCSQCKFSTPARASDFTIGDFWGVEKVVPDVMDDDMGISLLSVNSPKAQSVFAQIQGQAEWRKVDATAAWQQNHHGNVPQHPRREQFFARIDRIPIIRNLKQCLQAYFFNRILRKAYFQLRKIVRK